jgi:hypothetical protein
MVRKRAMTDQKHLEILKQGVAVWNKWRRKHPKIKPDFSNANGYDDFHSYDFKEINFRGADLQGANRQYVKCCVKVQGLVELELELASSAY